MILNKEPLIYFDIDDTLLMWDIPDKPYNMWSYQDQQKVNPDDILQVTDPANGRSVFLRKNNTHIALLTSHYARGYGIVVWSAGGSPWAQAAVKALQLEDKVDLVLAKPVKICDDLKPEEFLTTRIYIEGTLK